MSSHSESEHSPTAKKWCTSGHEGMPPNSATVLCRRGQHEKTAGHTAADLNAFEIQQQTVVYYAPLFAVDNSNILTLWQFTI